MPAEDLPAGRLRNKLSLTEKSNARAALCFVHIRSRHDDRDAFLPEIEQEPPQIPPRYRIDARRRFIQKQQLSAYESANRTTPAFGACRRKACWPVACGKAPAG